MDRSGGLPGVALPSVADPGLQANPPSSGLGWPSAIRRPATLLPDSNIFNSNFVNELKKSMVKNTKIQVVDNLTDNFRGYAALLRKIKQRVLLAQQRVIYAANE